MRQHGIDCRSVVNYDEDMESKVQQLVLREFGKRNIQRNMETIKLCLQYRQYLNVFKMHFDGKDLDLAILRALLSGK